MESFPLIYITVNVQLLFLTAIYMEKFRELVLQRQEIFYRSSWSQTVNTLPFNVVVIFENIFVLSYHSINPQNILKMKHSFFLYI